MLPKKDGQTEPYALEDMISDLQARHSMDHEDAAQDASELLKQRERDLVLAAELGKALLERNQELTKQAETLAEEYSSKLEVKCTESFRTESHNTRRFPSGGQSTCCPFCPFISAEMRQTIQDRGSIEGRYSLLKSRAFGIRARRICMREDTRFLRSVNA
jgi:hypothetical protein